ncbi:unnamed protein product [Caenorhabditis nigoni]
MYRQILTITLLVSFIVIADQCAATGGAIIPTTTTTATVTTTAAATTTVATACATCTAAQIIITTQNYGDYSPLTDVGVDANGCATITYTCERTPQVGTDVVLITYYADSETPRDVGTENGVGTANLVMNCVDGNWVKDGLVINEVECQYIT